MAASEQALQLYGRRLMADSRRCHASKSDVLHNRESVYVVARPADVSSKMLVGSDGSGRSATEVSINQ
jgi:hypothetical protein